MLFRSVYITYSIVRFDSLYENTVAPIYDTENTFKNHCLLNNIWKFQSFKASFRRIIKVVTTC